MLWLSVRNDWGAIHRECLCFLWTVYISPHIPLIRLWEYHASSQQRDNAFQQFRNRAPLKTGRSVDFRSTTTSRSNGTAAGATQRSSPSSSSLDTDCAAEANPVLATFGQGTTFLAPFLAIITPDPLRIKTTGSHHHINQLMKLGAS